MEFYNKILIVVFGLMISHGLLHAQKKVDVLIIGGGAGGTSAAIQASRMGVQVQIIEATPWLGGMLTSAGVSAIDGNHELPSGIWGEFRERLRSHYGGVEALATGWVSHTLFEPRVGNHILKEMAHIPHLDIAFDAEYETIHKDGENWLVTYRQSGKSHQINAKILIDATETGELLPLVGADFRMGMDAKGDTGEVQAPEKANTIVQDLTYVAILEDIDTKKGRFGLVKKPRNYNSKNYECACKREDGEMLSAISNCDQMLNYGKLPNNKYMINWPNCGNDYYLNWPGMTKEEKVEKLKTAKQFTQGFIYYIQNELGYKNLRMAKEFPTTDYFPMIPYEREGRRVKGKVFLTALHLENPYDFNLYRTGIAVGDYPIDHHHDKNPDAPEIDFIDIKVPSYTIPIGALIPEDIENFIVAEKNISVSNIVNGTTRLQPVVLGIGQAAGALAATAINMDLSPSQVSIRQVQNTLLEANAYLMPFIDVKKEDKGFTAMQRIGATGLLKGYGVPYKWANQTWFYPNQLVSEYEYVQGLLPYFESLDNLPASGKGLTLNSFIEIVMRIRPEYSLKELAQQWESWNIDQPLYEDTVLNRRTVSILTDRILDPFAIEVDFKGEVIE